MVYFLGVPHEEEPQQRHDREPGRGAPPTLIHVDVLDQLQYAALAKEGGGGVTHVLTQ